MSRREGAPAAKSLQSTDSSSRSQFNASTAPTATREPLAGLSTGSNLPPAVKSCKVTARIAAPTEKPPTSIKRRAPGHDRDTKGASVSIVDGSTSASSTSTSNITKKWCGEVGAFGSTKFGPPELEQGTQPTHSTLVRTSTPPQVARTSITKKTETPIFLPNDVMFKILSMATSADQASSPLPLVCRRWNSLCCKPQLHAGQPTVLKSGLLAGSINWKLFRNLGVRYKGTEGVLHHCIDRRTGRELAYRRARVFPDGDGVPCVFILTLKSFFIDN